MIAADYETLVEDHVAVILTRLRAIAAYVDLVFEGDVKGNPEQYLNVFHDTGRYSAHDMQSNQVDVEITFTVHSVGVERWQAVWGSGRVTAALLGHVPTIPGRRCWRITHAGSSPVQKDRDVEPPKFLAADRFVLRSTPRGASDG